jgi:DNA-binding transcriptional regulator YiaG
MVRKTQSSKKNSQQSATKDQNDKQSTALLVQQIQNSDLQNLPLDKPQTSPTLFFNGKTDRMVLALPIWEASNILTQKKDLPWSDDPNGKLCYAKEVENGKGAVYFWVTEDLEHEYPATLAGAAALAVIEAFDIRAACMHLIYAAHATQLSRPWEQEFVIDDRQIEEYLGLKKRTDKNRQQKLALIKEIAQQPCKVTTFISWHTQGKLKGFTVEEGRLWHLIGTRYHYEQDLFGNKELTGITFTVRAGLWARYFLNEQEKKDISTYCQRGTLSQSLLEDVMGVWQQREGAARLMVWLLFKTKVDRQHPLAVQTLMEIAYGTQKVQLAKTDSQLRKKLTNTWDEDLLTLNDRGWQIHFHSGTYSSEIQPLGFGRTNNTRPRKFFEQLLSAFIWINPPDNWSHVAAPPEENQSTIHQVVTQSELIHTLSGIEIKTLRTSNGWSQRKLAALTGISQGLISLIENGERTLTQENQEIIERTFALYS